MIGHVGQMGNCFLSEYFLEDAIEMVHFIPPPLEKKKKKREFEDEDEDVRAGEEDGMGTVEWSVREWNEDSGERME